MFVRFSNAIDTLLRIQNAVEASRNADIFGLETTGRGSRLAVNLFENGEDLVLFAEIPGVKKEDVKIEIKDNLIRLSGHRSVEYPEKASVHRVERRNIEFDRTVKIPIRVDVDQVKAEYQDGILKISLPRAEADKPRLVAVA